MDYSQADSGVLICTRNSSREGAIYGVEICAMMLLGVPFPIIGWFVIISDGDPCRPEDLAL